jgi:hypothetical protein
MRVYIFRFDEYFQMSGIQLMGPVNNTVIEYHSRRCENVF